MTFSHRKAWRERRSAGQHGFTLIELLAVIAIIGILAAILIPTTSGARNAANKARARAQYAQWGAAIESFRHEYGYYPTFETAGAGANKVNGNTTAGTNLAAVHRFYETLVGTRRDGMALPAAATGGNPPSPQAQNTRRIQFIAFTDADLVPVASTDAARRGLIRDAFDNTDIAVLVDRNLDGRITVGGATGDVTALPTITPPDGTARITLSAAEFQTGTAAAAGVRAGVIFYSAPPKATTAADVLMSWK